MRVIKNLFPEMFCSYFKPFSDQIRKCKSRKISDQKVKFSLKLGLNNIIIELVTA